MTQATPDNNTTPLPRLGHYQLQQCIGRGGMGLVYRARDTRLEREVAIKCLRTELFEAHYIERFKREALLLAKLNHPNIVQIYDFIEEPEQLALVMELVDGQNLHTYLREHIVPIAQRLQWLAQISEGLAVAHDAGIIHRDLKTENILINKRGQAKITDLGIAKSQDFKGTLTDHVAGSYCSMSPEQALGEAITFKSDLFSLGILAYQLLCGAHPFGDTSNKMQTMQRIISHPPTAPQQHNPDLPAEFIDLLGQLLSKDPDKRPDNTHWVAAQFEKLKDLGWREESLSDDTQALAIPLPANKPARTQDHPTFETRFIAAAATPKVSLWEKFKKYVSANKIVVSSATASLLIIAGIVVWQLQPKPPKYVAVIPPKLVAEGMQESQQNLVKGAVYDALQQSVIQLDGHYLIPQNEITDVNGDNESIRRATAADEVFTTEINCSIDACTITLTRLTAEKASNRLRVENIKTFDILKNNYSVIAEFTSQNLNAIYNKKSVIPVNNFDDIDYQKFIEIAHDYRKNGASKRQIEKIKSMSENAIAYDSLQSLYCDIALDLFYESNDGTILNDLQKTLESGKEKNSTPHLENLFYLKIAQKQYDAAKSIVEKIEATTHNKTLSNELYAYYNQAINNHESAIELFQKSVQLRKTSNGLYYLANAYWRLAKTTEAKKYIDEALSLSPNDYKILSLKGIIHLIEGDTAQAVSTLKQVLFLKPDDIDNIGNLGISYSIQQDYALALDTYNAGLTINPKDIALLLNKADALNLAGRNKEAQTLYKSIIDNNEAQASHRKWGRLAQAYAHLGLFNESMDALRKLENIDADNIETIYIASLVHALARNNTLAIFNVKKSLESGMGSEWYRFNWFDGLCKETEFQKIMRTYEEGNRCPL